MNTRKPIKASHRLYLKYEYLADIYANKLFETNAIGMDRKDVVQEMKLKIFTSIKGYARRWKEYKKTGNYKPVPLQFYLQTAMNNKLKDMVDDIQKDVNKNSLSVQEHNFDYGVESRGLNVLNLKDKEVIIGGIDILQGLQGKEKDAFCMFLKGHSIPRIEKIFKGKVSNVGTMIKNQVETLREFKDELLDGSQRVSYSYQLQDED